MTSSTLPLAVLLALILTVVAVPKTVQLAAADEPINITGSAREVAASDPLSLDALHARSQIVLGNASDPVIIRFVSFSPEGGHTVLWR